MVSPNVNSKFYKYILFFQGQILLINNFIRIIYLFIFLLHIIITRKKK